MMPPREEESVYTIADYLPSEEINGVTIKTEPGCSPDPMEILIATEEALERDRE